MLSVIFDSDSFFYGISDVNNNLMMARKFDLEGSPFTQIPEIIARENLANHYYSAVNVFSKSNRFTFIPDSEYNYGEENAFAANAFPFDDNDESIIDVCSEENLHILHAIEKAFLNSFVDLKKDLNVKHISLAYIQSIRENGVYVNVAESEASILVRHQDQFVFYNHFQTQSVEDRLYFIMLTFDQLGLDPSVNDLFLYGEKSAVVETKEVLKSYIANIKRLDMGYNNLEDSSEILDLYLASICE